MTDEVRQAIREVARQPWVGATSQSVNEFVDRFVAEIEAKVSPKHPPAGTPCWVWGEGWEDYEKVLAVSTGDGDFYSEGCNGGAHCKWDHYRVIHTAQDALKAIETQQDGFAPMPYRGDLGLGMARQTVQDLIDNAQEG